jgi:AFG3 family protein
MKSLRKTFLMLLILAVVAMPLAGCKSKSEHPSGEQPTEEHPTDEHPTEEHTTEEHPTEEHPSEHPQ